MPYPEYIESLATVLIGFILPLFTVLSFAFIIPPVLKRIVQEKRDGVKELMKMMGLPTWMNWVFYFFDALMTLVFTILLMVIIACIEWEAGEGKVLEFSDPSIVFFFFLFYSMALVVFLFSISTIFSNRKCIFLFNNIYMYFNYMHLILANLALTAGIVIHIVGFMIVFATINDDKYASMSGGAKIFYAMIYPNIGLQWGIKVMVSHEISGAGAQWSNLFSRKLEDDPITMGVVWVLFLVNVLIFGTITWYIDSVHPGPYGVAKKWYFCFRVCISAINVFVQIQLAR